MLRSFLATLAVTLGLVATSAEAKTVRMAVTDLVGLEELQREFGEFKKVLTETTGYEIEFLPVSNRTAAVEALRFKKVDLVMTGPAEYVVIKKRAPKTRIVAGLSRPDYFAVVVTLANAPYNLAKDLKGKKVGIGPVGSTSRHLGPIQVFADGGLEPLKQLEITHTKAPMLWEALKRGDVQAIGFNNTDFLKLRAKEAEGGLQPGAFRVIGRGPDLPNDMLMAGEHVEAEVVETIRKAFAEHGPRFIDAILVGEENKKYKGMQFLTKLDDKDYNYVRSMYRTAGFPEYSDFIGD
ncbi:Phosphonate ABC transporter phosphate-binding periplasmic component [Rhodospirillaceae bacterium LM-1]|nr:Phosphonate ABC transporter phosphate-binding periplasmic component [Rhodospirillaceae bacterium LM-1]